MENANTMTTETLNQTGFIFVSYSNSIEELTYRDYLRQYGADETTSPNGVAPRIHVREIKGAVYEHIKLKR
jgi:hypothetical protein